MNWLRGAIVLSGIHLLFFGGTCDGDSLIVNGDFETTNFTGWTVFTTSNGTLGTPSIAQFDTANSGTASWSARFQVGSTHPDGSTQEGGGIFQDFIAPSQGNVSVSLKLAAFSQYPNIAGGLVRLSLDQQAIGQWDFGEMPSVSLTEYGNIATNVSGLSAGSHEVRILVTRAYGIESYTPVQYVDNVILNFTAVPEPSTFALAGLGAAALIILRRSKSAKA